jgi:hypothetical protein
MALKIHNRGAVQRTVKSTNGETYYIPPGATLKIEGRPAEELPVELSIVIEEESSPPRE